MKRKAKQVRNKLKACRECRFNQHSLVLGLIHDVLVLIRGIIAIVAWPCRAGATAIHAELRKHPAFRFKHAHSVICITMGLGVLALSFVVEHCVKHPASGIAVETLRAAGVCPVWETISAAFKLGADFET